MNYLCSARRFVCRHKLATAAVAIGTLGVGSYIAYKKVNSYVGDFSQIFVEMAEQQRECFFQGIKYQETIQNDLTMLVRCLDEVIPLPTADEITETVKSLQPDAKRKYWEELKILSFTRFFVVIYSQIIYSICMRLQLTIIAKYIYIEQQANGKKHKPFVIDAETKLTFLKSARYVFSNGFQHLRNSIECAVSDVVSQIPLNSAMTFEDMLKVVVDVRAHFEPELLNFMLEPEQDRSASQAILKTLENESRNIIESVGFRSAINQSLDESFEVVASLFRHFYDQLGNGPHAKYYLAKFIPVLRDISNTLQSEKNDILSVSFDSEAIGFLMKDTFYADQQ